MEMLLDLAEAKTHLKVDGNEQDVEVTSKSLMASAIVVDYLKRPDHGWTVETVPPLVKAAMLLVLESLFDDSDADPLTIGVMRVLHRSRDPALA